MEVDVRKVGRVLVVGCLVALAVVSTILFVAGARKNSQIAQLHEHGVVVEVTVTRCLGLLGGSGSNAAGYACNGTYALDGHRYSEAIPGDALLAPGSTIRGVAVAGDPGLLSTPAAVAAQHTSWNVFAVPAVLSGVLAVSAGSLLLVRLRRRPLG
ncbi:MAG TPA: hypothetical protein VMR97_09900 [Acidimicrobiales bacterium]|nr:hypothetical protein [Acidimicrobiales bacterium]